VLGRREAFKRGSRGYSDVMRSEVFHGNTGRTCKRFITLLHAHRGTSRF